MTITEDQVKRLGKNLTDIMYRRGVTQAQMSNELRVPKTTVSSWMNGRRMPRAAAGRSTRRRLWLSEKPRAAQVRLSE